MHIDRRKWLICAATAAAAAGPAARAQVPTAAPWPTRPLRLVAGGVTDIRARWVAQRLALALGQAVAVENVAAAGGNLAAADVARSASDGHTVLFMHQGIAAFNPHLYARPGYDMLTDLRAVTRLGNGSLLLAVSASPEAAAWFAASGAEADMLTPAAMAEYVRAEHARWGQFVRQVGLEAE